MRTRMILVVVMLVALVGVASAQMTHEQANALQRAVARIANTDYSIENVIFDGMTIDEVRAVLDEPVVISYRATFAGNRSWNSSSHGTWLILWSEHVYRMRPVVVGFLRRGETRVRHNYVENVR